MSGKKKATKPNKPTRPPRLTTARKPAGDRRPVTRRIPMSTMTGAFSVLEPNWTAYLDYVRLAARDGKQDMKRYMDVHDHLDRRTAATITPEEVCERANVNPWDLMAEVERYYWQMNNSKGSLITAKYAPKVIEKTAKSAIGNSRAAQADRTNFLKGTGFIPQSKPGVFIAHAQISPGMRAELANPANPLALPSHEEEMKQLDSGEVYDLSPNDHPEEN